MYLQSLLDQHIEPELPEVRDDIRIMMQSVQQDLSVMGEHRPTMGHLRMFLAHLAIQFHSLTTSALNGTYHETDATFFGATDNECGSRRLRATVHQLNAAFVERMRQNS